MEGLKFINQSTKLVTGGFGDLFNQSITTIQTEMGWEHTAHGVNNIFPCKQNSEVFVFSRVGSFIIDLL